MGLFFGEGGIIILPNTTLLKRLSFCGAFNCPFTKHLPNACYSAVVEVGVSANSKQGRSGFHAHGAYI